MRTCLALLLPALAISCSSSGSGSTGADAGTTTDGAFDSASVDALPPEDAPAIEDTQPLVDTAVTAIAEQEPNNGAAATDVNAWPIPGDATGAIDPADDLDILAVTLTAGDTWTWSLAGAAGGMTPHLAISEKGNRVPTMVATAGAGGVAEQEHFVLETETYYVIVRDARNVPASTSAHVGGPDLRWRASARPLSRIPTPVTFPRTVSGKLDKRTAIALYAFSGTKDYAFDITLRAQRKTPSSDLDSRMSLYERTTKKWILTNDDDDAAATKDSKIGGVLPVTGEYIVVVENVAPAASDLSFELAFTAR